MSSPQRKSYLITLQVIMICFFLMNHVFANESLNLDKKIQQKIEQDRIRYDLPAISLSIKLPGENTIRNYANGFYADEVKKVISPETLFKVGSITKSVTATLIFKLIEENKLYLNDKLVNWFPQYPRWKDITIKQLLNHTSGTYNYTQGKSFDELLRKNPYKNWTLNEIADYAYQHADYANPDKKYHYSNTDYVLLGLVLEKVRQQPIKNIFDNYFKQFQLTHSYYLPNLQDIKNKIAHGYNRDGTFKNNTDVTFFSESFTQSSGAIISTPNDIVKWLQLLFDGKIISQASLLDMTSIISEQNLTKINLSKLSFDNKNPNTFIEIGAGSGIGLVYFKNYGFNWVHAGGILGYESFYSYNPCNGIYLSLTYSVKPSEEFIFLKITQDIFDILTKSSLVQNNIRQFQHHTVLPKFCGK